MHVAVVHTSVLRLKVDRIGVLTTVRQELAAVC